MDIKEWLGDDNTLGLDIWEKKYRHDGESFDEWLDRVSGGNEDIKCLITEKKFLFGGRVLAGRNIDSKVSYSNCYVIKSPEDNIEDIFRCCSEMARTYSYGGGVGIDISKLRPKGSNVNNAAKSSSGATSFMPLFSQVTETISNNGRRAALMISMSCEHPDIDEFIHIKSNLEAVKKANISLRMSDNFMKAVVDDKEFELSFKTENGEEIKKTINARDFFMEFARMNWYYAEPGCLFWDRISNYNIMDHTPELSWGGVNPCSEEPLPAYGACNLGSINLSEYVIDDLYFKDCYASPKKVFDFTSFKRDVMTCVFALNDVLLEGIEKHPLKQQRQMVSELRQIGLGIMGLGDMLIKLGIDYGSDEAVKLCEEIGRTMINFAVIASVDYRLSNHVDRYGAEFALPYKYYNPDKFKNSNFVKATLDKPTIDYVVENGGMFNSQILTCAPTGSLSNLLQISGGIEPLFSFSFWRKTESLHGKDKYYEVTLPIVDNYMKRHKISDIKDLPKFFVKSHDIHPLNRIKMQAVWQKYIDASISSTVNLNNNATIDDVFNLYIEAWKNGLKGITVYRDGCARQPILSEKKDDKKEKQPNETKSKETETLKNCETVLKRGYVIKPVNRIGITKTLMVGCGHLHCTVNFDKETGEFVELFLGKGSDGGCWSNLNGLARMVSLAARGGIPLEKIIDQLKSAPSCDSYTRRTIVKQDTSLGKSCPSAIAYAILEAQKEFLEIFKNVSHNCGKPKAEIVDMKNKEKLSDEEIETLREIIANAIKNGETKEPNIKLLGVYDHALSEDEIKNKIYLMDKEKISVCPDCGHELQHAFGCVTCQFCGWSKCG